MKMVDIFGPNKKKQYMKFIDNNYEQGEDKVIMLWIEHVTKK